MKFVVVGNPGNRRVAMFADAVRAAGLPPAKVVAWREILAGTCAIPTDSLVRVDSPGEDPYVDRLLRGAKAHPYRVDGSGAWYSAFTKGLQRLRETVAGTPGARLLNDVDDIAVMFDKRRCHEVLRQAGCPVPPTIDGVDGYATLREKMRERGWTKVFLKPAHGSSASGVVALTAHGSRAAATTSVAMTPEGLMNSLRVHTYRDDEVADLVDRLCVDPVHVERWFPKASLNGRTIDLRVVVIAGQATHAVVRASRHPITNLHLGGTRMDVAGLRAVIGEPRWREWLDTCEKAAARFGRTLMVGVDLLPGIGWRRHVIGEVNAFGDLLPRLTGLPDGPAAGLDTYAAQVAACTGVPCRT
ncbi:STM4014 family protein [Kibdelosporangium persicum]|uniref:Glutathione synthase/Ribosomal protein S6 modification enzyme (Glutaminyl transferase) n=1 Tax=Kibdelosporangium persicum TaxID=2698649 RepID=A0ABX2FDB6_9PSEU|nr:STM4014 family protein [Kibdelosporangium persicum]NRN68900.1 Glutathione synthase/Ribosomal protein S6 modification enzyme (Glutaminyl transferase) [Kibdelosporangium persicum]